MDGPAPEHRRGGQIPRKFAITFPDVRTIERATAVKAILGSKSDYLFMLEHDWLFVGAHNAFLDEIMDVMAAAGITHFRFNKRANVVAGWDRLQEGRTNGDYCAEPVKQHIIHREKRDHQKTRTDRVFRE